MKEPSRTNLYLLRHAATEANLASPPRLQGRRHNPPLARAGKRQAELTREYLAVRCFDVCYTSPLQRAVETAAIIAAPHALTPLPLKELTECDLGKWEGMDWQQVRYLDAAGYARYLADPDGFSYPGGESAAEVSRRVCTCLDGLLIRHEGQSILVVAHQIVNRTYLASLMGLEAGKARHMNLDNCGISIVTRTGGKTAISTLNSALHLQGLAA